MADPWPGSGPLPVAAPRRVRDWLAAAPDGPVPVLHRGSQALYVDVGGRAVGLLAQTAVAVPVAVRSTIDQIYPHVGVSAYLEAGILHIDGRPLSVRRVVDVHIPRLRQSGTQRNTADSATLAATPPAAVAEFVVSRAPRGITADAVPGLVGAGDGLTPLGDDVLCGWLAVHRAAEVPTPDVDAAVRDHLPRTTLLSATLLDCAMHGESVPQLSAWIHAVGRPDEVARATALLAIGGSSGAGLMAGAALALTALHHAPGMAA